MYTPIIGTLGFVLSPDKKKVLLVHRNKKKNDVHLGFYNGLGGKMESDEDIFTCMEREIHEEAGIICTKTILRGTINWTNFGPKKENWLGFIFRIDEFKGEPFNSNADGELHWMPIDNILELPMWEGDKHFLPMIFDENPSIFHGVMSYNENQFLSWSYKRS